LAFDSLRNLFAKTQPEARSQDRATLVGPRIPRHSTGWAAMLKHLQEEESLHVLDIGPTSATNVNLLTGLGHSLFMSDLVIEAQRAEWRKLFEEDPAAVGDFLDQNLNFKGRLFDVVLLWTTLDFVPASLALPMIARLHANLNQRGRILAFFHSKLSAEETIFYRYHVTESDRVEMQEAERLPLRQVYTTRQIEKLFSSYKTCKFFLAKDNLAEVLVTR